MNHGCRAAAWSRHRQPRRSETVKKQCRSSSRLFSRNSTESALCPLRLPRLRLPVKRAAGPKAGEGGRGANFRTGSFAGSWRRLFSALIWNRRESYGINIMAARAPARASAERQERRCRSMSSAACRARRRFRNCCDFATPPDSIGIGFWNRHGRAGQRQQPSGRTSLKH
jgi:hypothetical protein